MIQDTLKRLEARLADAHLSPAQRDELTRLVHQLRAEVDTLATTHPDAARHIVDAAEVSAQEATRDTRDDNLLDVALQGLAGSVREFEESHPQLAASVNAVAVALSNIGL